MLKIIERKEGEPALARCRCGTKLYLDDPLDNVCGGCGACYNMSGQRVTPSHECDAQGNPFDGY